MKLEGVIICGQTVSANQVSSPCCPILNLHLKGPITDNTVRITSACTKSELPVIHLEILVPGKDRMVQTLTLRLLPGNGQQ